MNKAATTTASRWSELKDILADALEQSDPAERDRLVQNACGKDTALLEQARWLLSRETTQFDAFADIARQRLREEVPSLAGQRLGAYVVLREIARGGMGKVYHAARADGQFKRDVAIKVLKRGTDTDEVLRRFTAERHILAELDHPNIARLLDAGTTDDGLPYFIMELVAGSPVTSFVREKKLGVEERLDLFLKICSAVEVAHQHHVIHRDLKPSNILVNAAGEPKLLDFGIAKLLEPASGDVTILGHEQMTPIWASPEQTEGRAVTEASDVYALGALLYELLTEKQPYRFANDQPTREEIVHAVREQTPRAPSTVAAGLRRDLDAIILKALRKNPAERYATVGDFAADIRRHLSRQRVLARRRSRAPFIAAAGILLLAAALWVGWRTQPNKSSAVPAQGKSIAVLPFEQFSESDDRSYFADGVQDNILTDLGKVSDLKVISRSGVAGYRGKDRDVRQIGRDLGVANVLEGSVQISGDRVRINAQLIDTRTAAQVWAEHYDRQLKDLFALQSELAQTIVAQLKATLSSGEKVAIWKKPTEDLQAYDLYLRARAAVSGAGPFAEESVTWTRGIELLTQALARDPKFTRAHCLVSELHLLMYRFGMDHTPARLAAAKEAAETALRLEPTAEESRLAMARYFYNGLNDYRRTSAELESIAATSAHTVDFYTLASLVERRLGKWEESIRDGEKAIGLDPQNLELAVNLSQTLTGLRRLEQSERVVDAAIGRGGGAAPRRVWLVKTEIAMVRGDLATARAVLQEAPQYEAMDLQTAKLINAWYSRDWDRVAAIVERTTAPATETPSYWALLGVIRRTEGKADEARRCFEEAKRLGEAALVNDPRDSEALNELALAEAGLGRGEEAVRRVQRSLEIMPLETDALIAPRTELRFAEVMAIAGDREAALQNLKEIVKLPFALFYGDLKLSPIWDGIRDDPRFAAILDSARQPLPLTE